MFVIPDARLDQFMAEDISYMDLTTHVLGIDQVPGRITFFTREAGVVCATEEAARILEKCGAQVEYVLPSGSPMDSGQEVLVATGSAG
ncbi:MAG: ModD protein, partial [Eggerthellales bacterium]|nr:ModD protein [Eggerthellales bacterium]